jgi:hypothetical protein
MRLAQELKVVFAFPTHSGRAWTRPRMSVACACAHAVGIVGNQWRNVAPRSTSRDGPAWS